MKPKDNSGKFRATLEVVVETLLIFIYIWFVDGKASLLTRNIFLWGLCVGFPINCIITQQRSFPEFSLDWQEFVDCLRILIWFTLCATVGFVFLALISKTVNYDGHFWNRTSEYFFWAFLQQIGLQTFLTFRVGKFIRNPYKAAFVSAVIFSSFHFPNPALVSFTLVSGFFWAYSYLRTPNLYAIAISHGWLAVVAFHCTPKSWLHNLRVGPTYWKF